MRFVGQNLPGPLLAKIGETASHKSRTYTSETKAISIEKAIKLIRTHAKKAYDEKPFDLIVTGHVHVKDDYNFEVNHKKIRSINLGSWINEPWVLELENGNVCLNSIDD